MERLFGDAWRTFCIACLLVWVPPVLLVNLVMAGVIG